jgi:hypothetical protein
MENLKVVDELALYDLARKELRTQLTGKFPADFDLDNTITAYAYWVCSVMRRHGRDLESVLQEYIEFALSDAILESLAERVELATLRCELPRFIAPLLDVGAGWGRFSELYLEYGLQPIYSEPSSLGCSLLVRKALPNSVRCLGQALSFPAGVFSSVVIGWVLHHEAPETPASEILDEITRVTAPMGRLLSIEPLFVEFDEQKWHGLITSAGFEIEKSTIYYDLTNSEGKKEKHACLVAMRQV